MKGTISVPQGALFFLNTHVYETVPLGHWGTEIVPLRVPYYRQSNSPPRGSVSVPVFLSVQCGCCKGLFQFGKEMFCSLGNTGQHSFKSHLVNKFHWRAMHKNWMNVGVQWIQIIWVREITLLLWLLWHFILPMHRFTGIHYTSLGIKILGYSKEVKIVSFGTTTRLDILPEFLALFMFLLLLLVLLKTWEFSINFLWFFFFFSFFSKLLRIQHLLCLLFH